MKALFVICLLAINTAAVAGEPPATKTFNVRDFGATGDGATYDTAAIQKALDACDQAGGGTVKLPPGIFLSGPLTLRSQATLLLEAGATLLASPQPSDFLKNGGDWLKAKSGGDFIPFIGGRDLTNAAIAGPGTIDGNGQVWWEEAEKARQKVSGFTLPRPNLIVLNRCQSIRLTGVRLINSPKFHFVPTDCEDVLVDGITILAPERAANTDGIDPSNCRRVKITRCLIDTGDDNIAIKSGSKVAGREFGCEDIEVTDCIFKHGHGLSIGSEEIGGVRNVRVSHCTFTDTDNGLRIKSRRERGGLVENISYTDIQMTNVHPAISIMAYYQNGTHSKYPINDPAKPFTDTTPVFRNIRIANVTATSTADAGLIVGLPESLAENIELENVRITAQTGFIFANAKGIKFNKLQVTAANGPSIIRDNAQIEGMPDAN